MATLKELRSSRPGWKNEFVDIRATCVRGRHGGSSGGGEGRICPSTQEEQEPHQSTGVTHNSLGHATPDRVDGCQRRGVTGSGSAAMQETGSSPATHRTPGQYKNGASCWADERNKLCGTCHLMVRCHPRVSYREREDQRS
jgi:hypothetical protein